MMASLPYITAPGNIDKTLKAIKSAATPERVTQDFVKTILKISGGSGDQVTSFLKKIGFANTDGTPSEIYKKFRNPATAGQAAAEALKVGYAPLYKRNEYMHELQDKDLKGLIIEETGLEANAGPVLLALSAIKAIKVFCNFSASPDAVEIDRSVINETPRHSPVVQLNDAQQKLGFNLSYTINLNLPATSDIAVFNAIFKSLKENLLKDGGSSE